MLFYSRRFVKSFKFLIPHEKMKDIIIDTSDTPEEDFICKSPDVKSYLDSEPTNPAAYPEFYV